MSAQLNELRLQVERLDYNNKENIITIDILKEQNIDAKSELEELRKTIVELRSSHKDVSTEDKEKRKQEKMALMMAQFDTVGIFGGVCCVMRPNIPQQGTFSEKDEQLRQILAKLDSIDSDAAVSTLSADDITQVRRQLTEGQSLVRETVDRLRQRQEENGMITRRKDELEARLATLEAEYEELLGSLRRF